VKFSGIGCSSKTTAYFATGAHGFNGVHGRMPSVSPRAPTQRQGSPLHRVSATRLLSIGFGQFAHAIRAT